MAVPVSHPFSPAFFALAVVLSGSLLYWCCLRIPAWNWQLRLPVGWLLTSLMMWPFLQLTQGLMISAAAETFRVGLIIFYAPRRAIGYTAAGWMAAALLLCIPLTAVDAKYWHHRNQPVELPLKYLLMAGWIVAVVLSSIGAAFQDTRRGPRFLVAIAAPWIAMFALLAQMHQRYLLWGSTLSSAAAALNPGYALLHLLLSVIAMSQEMQSMFEKDRRYSETMAARLIDGWHPGIGWAVVLVAMIFVYLAVRPARSRNAHSSIED
jgi:hypothetical protein